MYKVCKGKVKTFSWSYARRTWERWTTTTKRGVFVFVGLGENAEAYKQRLRRVEAMGALRWLFGCV